ncbi:MAG: molybdenum ABC transporter ATP-binding protein, partial [Steroidobacter sp.]
MLDADVKLKRGDFELQMKFAVSSGSIVALFGPSGCGKTTTANLIAGLLNPDQGRIAVGDQVLFDSTQNINIPAEQRGIGYVFQNARLFPHLSVMKNLQYGLRRTRVTPFIDADFVIKLLDLRSLLERHPKQLSGGEQQRVAIGRALLSQPTLLLLDEPLSSLDIARRNEVLPYLERLRDSLKIYMLYVSHQFEEVLRLATHVVLMNKGQCIAQGQLNQLSLQPELRSLLNEEAIGAVIDSEVTSINADGLA